MNITSSIETIAEVQKIRLGEKGRLSIGQITNLIVDLTAAKQNLPPEQFRKIKDLFHDFEQRRAKLYYDKHSYTDAVINIIRKFDAVAPFEQYISGNGQEMNISLLMNYIRNLKH